jgi:hypothetical protein
MPESWHFTLPIGNFKSQSIKKFDEAIGNMFLPFELIVTGVSTRTPSTARPVASSLARDGKPILIPVRLARAGLR